MITLQSARFIPFRLKLLAGVLAVGGALLGFMTIALYTGLRNGMIDTLGSSMATAAAGMAPGLEAALPDVVARSSERQTTEQDVQDLRNYLEQLRTRMVREFPNEWLQDAGTVRQPDLLFVARDASGSPRIIASTLGSLEGLAYALPENTPSDQQSAWEQLSFDSSEDFKHPGKFAPHAKSASASLKRFGGRAPVRLMGGRSVGLLVVDADTSLIDSVCAQFQIVAGIIFGAVLFFLAVGAFALAWWFNRPVRSLNEGVARVAAGDFTVQLPAPRRHDEFDVLISRFNTMVVGLGERQRLQSSLNLASAVQRHLLPAQLPPIPGYELCHAVQYSEETGGDALDCFALSPNRLTGSSSQWAICVGDVSGHGIAAAMLMCWARANVRARAEHLGHDPAKLLSSINDHFMQDSPSGTFLTYFYATLDPASHVLRWCSAGHEPALVMTSTGIDRLAYTGPPLGVVDAPDFTPELFVHLNVGDLLYVGTDGVSEARSPEGQLLGREALESTLRALRDQPMDSIRQGLLELIGSHRKHAAQNDDIAFLLVRRSS